MHWVYRWGMCGHCFYGGFWSRGAEKYEENNYAVMTVTQKKRTRKNREGTFPGRGHGKARRSTCHDKPQNPTGPQGKLMLKCTQGGPLGRRQDTLGVLGWKGPDRECTVQLHDWARNSVWNCGGSASSSCEPLP